MEENTYVTDHYGERKEFTITELEEKAGKGDVESQMILMDILRQCLSPPRLSR